MCPGAGGEGASEPQLLQHLEQLEAAHLFNQLLARHTAMPGSLGTYLCFSWKPVCNIKLLKVKSQFKWTVGAGYFGEPSGEFSGNVNNHSLIYLFYNFGFLCILFP